MSESIAAVQQDNHSYKDYVHANVANVTESLEIQQLLLFQSCCTISLVSVCRFVLWVYPRSFVVALREPCSGIIMSQIH